MTPARRIWQQIETIHAVTYFAPESLTAAKQAGLKGFWMGYFGFRSAPMGAVSPGVVQAIFANFAPAMVRRAVPDVWKFATPEALLGARATSAAAALRRISPSVEEVASRVNEALEAALVCASPVGRPLFAANANLTPPTGPEPADNIARFWQNCTALREHRGDGHVAALAAGGIDGCEAHLLLAASNAWEPEVFFKSRGWTPDEQAEATARLSDRGLLEGHQLTSTGRDLRQEVEAATDALAARPYELAGIDIDAMVATLSRAATEIATSETIPFPNPMGLTPA